MATKADTETPTILRKLAAFLLLFYVIYYLVCIILVGALSVDWHELGAYPFRASLHDFNPGLHSGNSQDDHAALGSWLAMVATFALSLALCYWVVRATKRSWDYLLTTALLHWLLCCIVNTAFPTSWVWWLTLIVCVLAVSMVAELLIYRLRDLQDIELAH